MLVEFGHLTRKQMQQIRNALAQIVLQFNEASTQVCSEGPTPHIKIEWLVGELHEKRCIIEKLVSFAISSLNNTESIAEDLQISNSRNKQLILMLQNVEQQNYQLTERSIQSLQEIKELKNENNKLLSQNKQLCLQGQGYLRKCQKYEQQLALKQKYIEEQLKLGLGFIWKEKFRLDDWFLLEIEKLQEKCRKSDWLIRQMERKVEECESVIEKLKCECKVLERGKEGLFDTRLASDESWMSKPNKLNQEISNQFQQFQGHSFATEVVTQNPENLMSLLAQGIEVKFNIQALSESESSTLLQSSTPSPQYSTLLQRQNIQNCQKSTASTASSALKEEVNTVPQKMAQISKQKFRNKALQKKPIAIAEYACRQPYNLGVKNKKQSLASK